MKEEDFQRWQAYSAVNVTLENEGIIVDPDEWLLFSKRTRLQIIDAALPWLKRKFPEAERLKIGADYCRYLEANFKERAAWEKERKEANAAQEIRVPILSDTFSFKQSTTPNNGQHKDDSDSTPRNSSQSERQQINTSRPRTPPLPTSRPPVLPPAPQSTPPTAEKASAVLTPVDSGPSSEKRKEPLIRNRPSTPQDAPVLPPPRNSSDVELPKASQTNLKPEIVSVNVNVNETTKPSRWRPNKEPENIPQDEISESVGRTVQVFISVALFFYDDFMNNRRSSVDDYLKQHPSQTVQDVFDMLSYWLNMPTIKKPYLHSNSNKPAAALIDEAKALPKPPSLTISAPNPNPDRFLKEFTGYSLAKIARIKFARTRDIASHLYFDKINFTLYLYMTPGVCYSQNLELDNIVARAWLSTAMQFNQPKDHAYQSTPTSIPIDYTVELCRTFTFLFDEDPGSRKAFRDFQKTFPDIKPLLPPMRERSSKIGSIWTEAGKYSALENARQGKHERLRQAQYYVQDFPYFAERLLILEEYLRETRPSSLRQLMRDSRDQLQYYTFVTALVIFVMTIIGLILTFLQTIASFWQVKLALQGS
ncbi:hypothetical protein DFH27DRAFT_43603 [Peziza echinospora]|nr:hypothetical protein DFH27DRAFT_43603 [Peziza echinospora]